MNANRQTGRSEDRRTGFRPRSRRRILCVFPRYAPSFGTFEHAYALVPGVRAFMPPQGILALAAYLPVEWEVRFVDANVRPLAPRDLEWADAVFTSGMHVQRLEIERIVAMAHAYSKIAVVGGPSASACPEYYPEADILHLGEMGDATDLLFEHLDRSASPTGLQIRLETSNKLPLDRFPIPAYDLANVSRYFLGSVQFSSGCPFRCEFCDIPELYGRNPRLKTPEQVTSELDAILAAGPPGAVYFVDDNFIGNRKAATELMPHLVRWQSDRGYPLRFACEATLDLAGCPELLSLMREANFTTVFCGIETPEAGALVAMKKAQNLRRPILDAVEVLNSHGLEVVSGIIVGLDTDSEGTADRMMEFIEESRIPILTINLLYALPKTPLHRRLLAAGRIVDDPGLPSNVEFRLPRATVVSMWRRLIETAYDPDRLFSRFASQATRTYRHRLDPRRRVRLTQIVLGLIVILRVFWLAGVRSPYRRAFWRTVLPLLRQGRVEDAIHIGLTSHHLLRFAKDSLAGAGEASFYATPGRVRTGRVRMERAAVSP